MFGRDTEREVFCGDLPAAIPEVRQYPQVTKKRSYAQRELRQRMRLFARNNLGPLLALLALYLAVVVASHLLGAHGYWAGFANGFTLAAMVASVGLMFLLHTGGLDQVAGSYGETRTAEELEKARKKGYVWGAVANIELEKGDVDSLVFAPGGVLALEVKWRTRSLDRRWLSKDLEQARRGAARTRSVLRSGDTVGEVHDVTPVLVIWGKASLDVAPGGELVGGVHVVDGNELTSWLKRYDHGPLAQDNAERALNAVRGFSLSRVRG